MIAPQIKNVGIVLENWVGQMAPFVIKKQMAVAEVDPENPSEKSLYKLVDLIEEKCLVKILDPDKVKEVKVDLKKAIETPSPLENEAVIALNTRIRAYLRKKFGDVAVHTLNTQKRKLGIEEIRDPREYKRLAEEIYRILAEMVDEELAKEVHRGMLKIIDEIEKEGE